MSNSSFEQVNQSKTRNTSTLIFDEESSVDDEPSTSDLIPASVSRKRALIDLSSPPSNPKKKKITKKKGNISVSSMVIESEDDDDFDKKNRSSRTPMFVGRSVINQVKIQKALSKKQIQISLEEPGADLTNDMTFPTILMHTSVDDHETIDLLKIPATKGKANLFVTTLVQYLFTMEELVALDPSKTNDDERYQLIREAVRCKFRLSQQDLEQMFRQWLREVFLAKRLVAVSRLKSMPDKTM